MHQKEYDWAQSCHHLFAIYLETTETTTVSATCIPPASIPSSVPKRIAPAPDAANPAQLNNAKQAPIKVSMREPIGQDAGDRSIAHVVSGGLGQTASLHYPVWTLYISYISYISYIKHINSIRYIFYI